MRMTKILKRGNSNFVAYYCIIELRLHVFDNKKKNLKAFLENLIKEDFF